MWRFQVDGAGSQPYIDLYPFSPRPRRHPGGLMTLSVAPCATQEDDLQGSLVLSSSSRAGNERSEWRGKESASPGSLIASVASPQRSAGTASSRGLSTFQQRRVGEHQRLRQLLGLGEREQFQWQRGERAPRSPGSRGTGAPSTSGLEARVPPRPIPRGGAFLLRAVGCFCLLAHQASDGGVWGARSSPSCWKGWVLPCGCQSSSEKKLIENMYTPFSFPFFWEPKTLFSVGSYFHINEKAFWNFRNAWIQSKGDSLF